MVRNVSGGGDQKGRDNQGEDEAALRARLAQLSHKLDQQHDSTSEANDARNSSNSSFAAATNLGFQALIEFVTAIVIGPLIGWQIDSWFHTMPIFFIVFLILGMVAGLLNVYRLANRMGKPRDSR